MSYHEQLNTEIDLKIAGLEKQKSPIQANWIAHAICSDHEDGLVDNDHKPFWQHGGYATTRRAVTTRINKRRGIEPTKERKQKTLPGFQHVQDYYVVERDGSDVGVPTQFLTKAEIEQKIELYRTMGAACYEHADELERYKKSRAAKTA